MLSPLPPQFERGILDACISILDASRMPIHDRGDVIKVVRKGSAMVRNQGSAPPAHNASGKGDGARVVHLSPLLLPSCPAANVHDPQALEKPPDAHDESK